MLLRWAWTALLAGGHAVSLAQTNAAQVPQANPGRPTISNPARLPPVGYLQFEQGFLQANGSPSGLDRQFSLVQTTKLALHPRLMAQFASQPVAVSRFAASPGNPASSESDPGDLLLGIQGVLINSAGRSPTVAVGYQHRVRSGTAPDLDIGSFSQTATVFVSGDLHGFHYDSNYSISEQSDDVVRRAQFGQTLSVTHAVFPKSTKNNLTLTGEMWHFTQPLVDTTRDGKASPRSNAVGTLWALAYAVRNNLVLDCGFDHGLTSTSTAWQGFAGFTYLLPHRLWRSKN